MQELFNLRHASARNIIERIFGVLKRRFRILLLAPEYELCVQAQIPSALCAIHNFIRIHDQDEGALLEERELHDQFWHADGEYMGADDDVEPEAEMKHRRDQIARAMWEDYQNILAERLRAADGESDMDELEDDELVDQEIYM
jgi:hypothetical protein